MSHVPGLKPTNYKTALSSARCRVALLYASIEKKFDAKEREVNHQRKNIMELEISDMVNELRNEELKVDKLSEKIS